MPMRIPTHASIYIYIYIYIMCAYILTPRSIVELLCKKVQKSTIELILPFQSVWHLLLLWGLRYFSLGEEGVY